MKKNGLLITAIVLVAIAAALCVYAFGQMSNQSDAGDDADTSFVSTMEVAPAQQTAAEVAAQQLAVTVEPWDFHLPTSSSGTYFASNLIDGNLSTAWAFNRNQIPADADYVWGPTFKFSRPVNLESVEVVTGYAKEAGLWKRNGRVSSFMIYDADLGFDPEDDNPKGVLYSGTLRDTMSPQALTMKSHRPVTRVSIAFPPALERYKIGTKWVDDICMSEIRFIGTYAD